MAMGWWLRVKNIGNTILLCLRAWLLILRNMTPFPAGLGDRKVSVSRESTESGLEYDLYEPKKLKGGTFILLHGLTLEGEHDKRLMHFAKAVAASGLRGVCVGLPGLKSLRFDAVDIEVLADLATGLEKRYGSPPGVIGFSFGGGHALLAAAKSGCSISPLLLFSPHCSLQRVWETLLESYDDAPSSDKEWDAYIWVRVVLAYRSMDSLGMSSEERSTLSRFAQTYCTDPSIQEKKEFHSPFLSRYDLKTEAVRLLSSEDPGQLSPCGKLEGVSGQVLLLHDDNDPLVPSWHSEKIYEEITGANPNEHMLLTTPLLSHVDARASWRVFDLFRILRIMGEIFK